MTYVILASSSQSRRNLLVLTGIPFSIQNADVDERNLEKTSNLRTGSDIALLLAAAKAVHVSQKNMDQTVVGSDQVLELDGKVFHKSSNRDDAIRQITALSGRTHALHSAVSVAQRGTVVDSFVQSAYLTVRKLDEEAVQKYVSLAVEKNMLSSVGGYHFEGAGIELFSMVSGNYSTILGLPLQQTLKCLRRLGVR